VRGAKNGSRRSPAGRVRGSPPELDEGRPEPARPRHLSALTQGIAFERLAPVLSDLLGLEISVVRQLSAIPYQDRSLTMRGARINMLDAARVFHGGRRDPREAPWRNDRRVRRFSLTSLRAANRLKASARRNPTRRACGQAKKNGWRWVFHHDDSAFSSSRPRASRKWSKTGIKRQRMTKRTRRPYFTPAVKEACVVEYSTPWLTEAGAARQQRLAEPGELLQPFGS
jgi:hypothetical protein